MTGLVRKATLLSVCGLFVAGAALANVPDPAHSTVPDHLYLSGALSSNHATPDPGNPAASGAAGVGLFTFLVTVRDFANNPISGSHVVVDFSQACDINLCLGINASGQTTDCATATVSGNTNALGQIDFRFVGSAKDPGTLPTGQSLAGPGLNGVKVIADGVDIAHTTGICLDLNGALGASTGNAVNGADLGVLKKQVGDYAATLGAVYRGRADIDFFPPQNAVLNGADLGFEKTEVGRAAAAGPNQYVTCPLAGGSYCSKVPSTCP